VSSSDVIAVDVETDNATDGVALAAGDLTITDASGTAVDLGPIGAATTNEQRTSQIVDAINAKSSDTDIFAKIEYDATGAVTGYSVFSSSRTLDGSEFGGSFAADPTGDVGGATYADADFALEDIDINSFGAAQLAMKVIDTSIDSINSSRADLGALQSRFENAVANINITSENISAARGRIVDAAWPWADATLGAWLIAEAVAALQAEGADYVECLASTAALTNVLESAGFRRRATVPLWYHRPPAGLPEPDRWHLTLLDCDRAYR